MTREDIHLSFESDYTGERTSLTDIQIELIVGIETYAYSGNMDRFGNYPKGSTDHYQFAALEELINAGLLIETTGANGTRMAQISDLARAGKYRIVAEVYEEQIETD